MKSHLLSILSFLFLFSCKSVLSPTDSNDSTSALDLHKKSFLEMENQIFCSWDLSGTPEDSFELEAHVANNLKSSVRLIIRNRFPSEVTTIHRIEDSRNVSFEVPNHGWFQLLLTATPQIISKTIDPVSKNFPTKLCARLISSNKNTPIKPAFCNAVGTPASGWYQGGKVLKLREHCQSEILSCGISASPGWFVQRKINVTQVKQEKCGWMREAPRCMEVAGVTGWYLDGNLVVKDIACLTKGIQCDAIGTKREGWVTFNKSQPELLVASSCLSNREISYLEN